LFIEAIEHQHQVKLIDFKDFFLKINDAFKNRFMED
jgi:hypothetical protein